MHRYRLYVPPEKITGDTACLDGDEFHHCVNVLRRTTGAVTVFDGRSREWEASIAAVEKHRAMLRLDTLTREEGSPDIEIIVCPALTKARSFDTIVEAATELGAHMIVPIIAARSAAESRTGGFEARQARWRRIAIAAAKQSGRIALPTIKQPMRLDQLLPTLTTATLIACAAEENAAPLLHILRTQAVETRAIAILVGPEADFTPEEVAAVTQAGGHVAQLGPTTLRATTAVAYALSVVGAELAAR